jgi:hypothetical protein
VSAGDHMKRGRSVDDAIGILEGESPCLKDVEEFKRLAIGPRRRNSEELGILIRLSMGEVIRTSSGMWNVRSIRVKINMRRVGIVMWIVLPRDHRNSSETVGTIDLEKLDFEAMRKFDVTELKVRSMNLSPLGALRSNEYGRDLRSRENIAENSVRRAEERPAHM